MRPNRPAFSTGFVRYPGGGKKRHILATRPTEI